MQALHIRQPVTVVGKDYWGRPAQLTFSPHEAGERGWWWNTGTRVLPIDYRIAKVGLRHVTLAHGRRRLRIYEHIGGLKFTGLDSVVLSGTAWSPYDGSSKLFWQQLEPELRLAGYTLKWRTVTRSSCHRYGKDGERSVSFVPQDTGMTLNAHIDYPGLGNISRELILPAQDVSELRSFMNSKSQIWPMDEAWYQRLQRWEQFASRCRLPHVRVSQMAWPLSYRSSPEALWDFVTHRLWDMLGEASLIYHDALPAVGMVSFSGGHSGSLEAIKRLFASELVFRQAA